MMVSELLVELGGPARLGRALGVTTAAVSNWSAAQRVPPTHALAIWRMATAAGLAWTPPGAEGLRLVEAAPAQEAA